MKPGSLEATTFNRYLAFIGKHYLVQNSPRNIKLGYVILNGIILFYVLYVFEAFGIKHGYSDSGHGYLTRTIFFGLLNALLFYCFEFIISKRFNRRSLIDKLSWVAGQILMGGSAIFVLYNYFWNWSEWHIDDYLLLIAEYFSIMILPVSLYQFIDYRSLFAKTEDSKNLLFTSENGKDRLLLNVDHFLYIKAEKNYLEVFFTQGKEIKSHLIRNRLKNIESNFLHTLHIKRSHRSYLVNPNKVDKIVSSKGKTKLYIDTHVVPLSDQFAPHFLE